MAGKLKSFFRKVKRRFEPKDGSPGYQRRLRKELTRISRTFEGNRTPVLIQTYGKVGSTAIHAAINQLPGFGSFQTHFITKAGVDEARDIHHDHDRDPIHLKVGDRLREELANHPDKAIKVITLVRDPVARAVSNLFENPNLLPKEVVLKQLPLEDVVALAADQVTSSMAYTEKWFDRELNGLLGFNLFEHPFNKETGFEIIDVGRFQLLAGKLEQLANHGEAYLGEFLELGRDLEIERRRARSATGEASLYDQVREKLILPAGVLDEVYGSRVCRYFYTEEEVTGFRKNWE